MYSPDAFSLADRVAVVTGAASGLGRAIAIGLAQQGARVTGIDINVDGLTETAEEARRFGVDVSAIKCDVASESDVAAAFTSVTSAQGGVDILVNDAFTPVIGRPHELELEAWDRAVAVNLTGYFLCARAAGRQMIAQGRGGAITNISSIAGTSALGRGNFAYSVTKGAIVQMTRELAVEWGRYGIRVNAIQPVQFRTKGLQARLDDPTVDGQMLMARFRSSIPLGRIGEPDDIVGPVVFLSSDAAAMVTGSLLPVDGGNLAMNAGSRSDE